MGPCIVTADEIGDPHNLNILTHVNGVEKQNSNTRFMLFNINQLIADISSVMTLEPGDIIPTGPPAGHGAGRDPPEFSSDEPRGGQECVSERRSRRSPNT